MSESTKKQSVERELLERYRRERDKAIKDRADADARAERYEKAVTGLEAVLEDHGANEADETTSDAPTRFAATDGAAEQKPDRESAIISLVRGAGAGGLSPLGLTEGLTEAGLAPRSANPENAVRAAANRLRKKEPRLVFQNGKYVYRGDGP